MFTLLSKNNKNKARKARIKCFRGGIQTPCFMPIATKGAVKTLASDELRQLKPDIILGNTYHLMLRPGKEEISKLGGLHKFMGWDKPILTDSGGFQVFSLAKMRKISENGVRFQSHIDGREFLLTPEKSITVQQAIGADIMMALDECVQLPAERRYLEKSVQLTTRWAKRCKDYFNKEIEQKNCSLLFGIVQGGLEENLRRESAKSLVEIGFDGYAIGGLAVGETIEEMYAVLDYIVDELPEDKPRYLMGIGYPEQIIEAVKRGIDMFDCVIPTREARHGRLYFFNGSKQKILFAKNFYCTINISNEEFKFDLSPINEASRFEILRRCSKAYLRHLFFCGDPSAMRLATMNNLEFYLKMMDIIREEI